MPKKLYGKKTRRKIVKPKMTFSPSYRSKPLSPNTRLSPIGSCEPVNMTDKHSVDLKIVMPVQD